MSVDGEWALFDAQLCILRERVDSRDTREQLGPQGTKETQAPGENWDLTDPRDPRVQVDMREQMGNQV